MRFKSTTHTKTRLDSYHALKRQIAVNRYPFIFDNAVYKHDGEPIHIKCMFGHTLAVKPYELKTPYIGKRFNRNKLPKCYECSRLSISMIEMRHRVNTYYDSNHEIEVISRYISATTPIRYKIGNSSMVTTPVKMNDFMKRYPEKYRKINGLFFEQLLFERIDHEKQKEESQE